VGAKLTLSAGDVFRGWLILARADCARYTQIMRSLQTTAPTMSRWNQRFEEQGMASGLDPRHKEGQPLHARHFQIRFSGAEFSSSPSR